MPFFVLVLLLDAWRIFQKDQTDELCRSCLDSDCKRGENTKMISVKKKKEERGTDQSIKTTGKVLRMETEQIEVKQSVISRSKVEEGREEGDSTSGMTVSR